ncbi:trehalose-6-phosphate synthase, partial [Perilla frutescens var. hirtella]
IKGFWAIFSIETLYFLLNLFVFTSVKEFEARWIGWLGINLPDEIGQSVLTRALVEKRYIPIFLDEKIVHQYYNGYCNNIL